MARFRAFIELALACAAVVGCAISWSEVRSTVAVAPVADGQPVTTSVAYDPPLLLLTLLLATAAGILAVIGVATLRRGSRRSTA
jgi:NO-binding membrane sensor protein with MHYT domain